PSNPAPTVNFSASSSSVATGTTVTLTFSSSNATSCSASGSTDWTGDKGTSGSGDVKIVYGTNTFSLSCTGSGGSSSKSVTVDGTQGFDATAFVGTGTKTYRGFIIHKRDGSVATIATMEFDLSASQDDPYVLEFESVRHYELQYLGYYLDDDENPLGLKLSGQLLGNDDGTPINTPIADNSLNGIYLNSSVTVDPYNYSDATLDDLEQFSADINLDLLMDDIYGFPDLEMGVLALPNESPSDNASVFIGYSTISDNSYTVLYIEEKTSWDDNQSNKPSESDILAINLAKVDLFTSYQSLPNFVASDYGLRVKNEKYDSSDSAQGSYTTATLRGSFKADSITPSDNQVWQNNDYAVKYLYNDVSESDQRMFLKMDTASTYYGANIDNYEVYFMSPDKSIFVGFRLGGYDGTIEGDTNVSLFFNNDD
ncbi:hypothetical protein N9Z34_04180, partial [Gammaproteobacteria bacterium]|nr:hypothetical protein [Gammaproteobacteria bacterium]